MNWLQGTERLPVVGIDYPCLDYVVEIERIPDTNDEVDINNDSWQGGGMVPTALAALGRLGAASGMIGVVGSDAYGACCLKDLRRHGVDTSMVIVDEGKTTDFCISLAEGRTHGRSFLTRWGSRRDLEPSELPAAYIAQARYLHLCIEMNALNVAAAKIARTAGTKVVVDADHYSELTQEHLALIDVFIASEKYFKAICAGRTAEAVCREILEAGPEIVVFTMGAKGCVGMDRQGFFTLDAFHPGAIVDTTGAGDVFHGAFIYGLLDGRSTLECACLASAAASIKCLRLGGRAGIPNLTTVTHFLETGEVLQSDFPERECYYRESLLTPAES